jgi:molybdenum cofactor biosynthesis protein B
VGCAIVTVSDTRGPGEDKSGAVLQERLEHGGHHVIARDWVRDERAAIRRRVVRALGRRGVDAVLVTGGTGVAPRDVTPEALAPLITKAIPGFGELFRWLSYEEIGTSTIQSRAEAALCGATYVFLLPGSTNGVRTGLEKILIPQLDHRFKPCNFVMLLPRIKNEPTGRG